MNWVVSQVGRRQDYAVAREFQLAGSLSRLYTDVWVSHFHNVLGRGPKGVNDLPNRFHPEIDRSKVSSFVLSTFIDYAKRKLRKSALPASRHYRDELALRIEYDRWVAKRLLRDVGEVSDLGFFGFCLESLESLKAAKRLGGLCICDQFDPGDTEDDLVDEEAVRWPGWEPDYIRPPSEWRERMKAEWEVADLVLVNSGFSEKAVIAQGLDASKVVAVPLSYQPTVGIPPRQHRDQSQPLRVLWLGSVILRKGIQYLIEAAKLLLNESIEFTVAGPIGISQEIINGFPQNVSIVGKKSRGTKTQLFIESDVFVLPTISDGFAITQVEAMAHGLPVIATPNCGEVVTNGVDGVIVPIRDPIALSDALRDLSDNREKLYAMSTAALRSSARYQISKVSKILTNSLSKGVCSTDIAAVLRP